MPRIYATPTADKIIALLKDQGESMSAKEISEALNIERKSINSAIRTAKARRLMYIDSYRHNYGTQGKPAPMYWLGDMPDARAPAKNIKADKKRWADKMRVVTRLKDRIRRGKAQDHWMQILTGNSMKSTTGAK